MNEAPSFVQCQLGLGASHCQAPHVIAWLVGATRFGGLQLLPFFFCLIYWLIVLLFVCAFVDRFFAFCFGAFG